MTGMTPEEWHRRTIAAEQAGQAGEAESLMTQALAEHPEHPDLLNNAGDLAIRAGDARLAAERFAAALERKPASLDFGINLAIALTQMARGDAAVDVLRAFEITGRGQARYCSVRARASWTAGDLDEAVRWYDRCLAIEPRHPRALHGRARLALERAEPGTSARFDRALAQMPGDAELWLGKAQSLDVEGDAVGARSIIEQLLARAPHWVDGLRFLAQLRLAAGDEDYAAHFDEAARRVPADAQIPIAHCGVLGGLGHAAKAASTAANARRRFAHSDHLALLEAIHSGEAGDLTRAEAIFAQLPLDSAHGLIQLARHRIRQGRPHDADLVLERALAIAPESVSAWALRGIAWRMTADERAHWLHDQAGLVQFLPLRDGQDVIRDAAHCLDALHDGSPLPLDQSLRGGTQTRGVLFARREPELHALRHAIERTLDDYRASLPPTDRTHPLLRHRDAAWRIAGSWSVRLSGGSDHHTAHIHPQGILSSALYLDLPDGLDDRLQQPGWIELGRPPPDLRLDLPPLRTIRPQSGHLALFPSTLYHATRPFATGRRLTVAFDVAPSL